MASSKTDTLYQAGINSYVEFLEFLPSTKASEVLSKFRGVLFVQ